MRGKGERRDLVKYGVWGGIMSEEMGAEGTDGSITCER
jgi:hypothetical protein